MIFELPFDLIVMARTFPRAPDPAWSRVLFFAPLFLIEITTLALLTLSPMVQVSKATPGDIAHAVSFLASEGAGFITGQRVLVDGGRSLGN
jgi:NAD(P)-dependent dehydrogenase (short-subunit alcohol dehydrogenase family)